MSASSYTETEIKLYVPDLERVAQALEAAGAKLTAPRVYERNVRYENDAQTLTAQHIVVRLRQDTRIRLTYKEPPTETGDADIPNRFEAEVEVSDFDAMQVILGKLGYFPHVVYEKYRTTYELDTVEVVLDEMPYGNFVEIEGTADAIRTAIEQLELQTAIRCRTNYLELFEQLRQQMNLNFTDLTFDNFKNITVPPSAFEQMK